MLRLKARLLIAISTFVIGVLGVGGWIFVRNSHDKITTHFLVTIPPKQEQTDPEIRGFHEVVSAKDGTYVTAQGWIDPKFICRGERDLELSICTTALVGESPAENSMYIRLHLCNEQVKSSCIDWNPNLNYPNNIKLYDYKSKIIDDSHQIKITSRVSVVDGKGRFGKPIGRIESIDDSQNAIIPLSKIDLSLIGLTASKGRVQDLDYNQLPVVEQLILHKKDSIPFLINKLTDERKPKGYVRSYWNDVRVGDIAFFILTDFFTDISWENPTIQGASFNTFLGCNNRNVPSDHCYYNYMEKHGRKGIQAKWQKIWKDSKDNLYWDEAERCFRVKTN